MNDFIIESKGLLAPVKIKFTCLEWILQNAPYLSGLQVKRFQRLVAEAHRFIMDKQPGRDAGTYQYTSDSEVIFRRALTTVKKFVPIQQTNNSIIIDVTDYVKPLVIELEPREELLLGNDFKLYKLVSYLGLKIDKRDNILIGKLSSFVGKLRKKRHIVCRKRGSGYFCVTPELIDALKQFIVLFNKATNELESNKNV